MERVTTGLPGLDALLGGGLPDKTVVLLSGGPGTGKTLLGLNYLMDGVRKGENCCYLTLNEGRDDLLRACQLGGLSDAGKHVGGRLSIVPFEMAAGADLQQFENVFRSYPRTDRLVIDNVNKLLIYAEDKRHYRMTLSDTVRRLRGSMRSVILICETEGERMDTGNGEAFECDGVIQLSFLELEEKPKRTLRIHKMRYTGFDPKVQHELVINDQGLRLTEAKII